MSNEEQWGIEDCHPTRAPGVFASVIDLNSLAVIAYRISFKQAEQIVSDHKAAQRLEEAEAGRLRAEEALRKIEAVDWEEYDLNPMVALKDAIRHMRSIARAALSPASTEEGEQ